ncbi:MAG TPA: hypothetical protein PK954_06000, partial [Anaerolineales bacterium]|nr:hypothetical protein [Anaerolineales bacterium]
MHLQYDPMPANPAIATAGYRGSMTVLTHCLIVTPRRADDPRSRGLLHDAHALGLRDVSHITASDLYFIEGKLTAHDQ